MDIKQEISCEHEPQTGAPTAAWCGTTQSSARMPLHALLQQIGDYLELTKPRLSSLVLMTTAVGFWLGMRGPEQFGLLAHVLFGTALVVGGANAFNEWMERGPDGLMRRTQHRPLPSGRLSAYDAWRFALLLCVGGIVYLALRVNALSAGLAAAAAASYVLLYTPLKRLTALCTLAGAIPGALPPMIGWSAAQGTLGPEAWVLFALLFVWQLPHFLAIAVLYRDDYARAGFRMLPVTEASGFATARQMLLYGLTLLPLSLFPTLIGLSGRLYFCGALLLSMAFFIMSARAALIRSAQTCRQLFLASVLYLPVLLGLLAYDRLPR